MEATESRSGVWRVLVAACAIVCLPLLAAPTGFQLAVVAVSTVIAGAIILATTIAVTGRSLW